ncbi:unnamed protein product [Lactuca saligna]|uniref:Uncharacterized protein n=1 Tax=Lactuca saligna TaxID=75948 RepID=A0AA35ZMK0_LACSI|nr:unnamed protein product [Lactuca saligna]
MVLGLVFDSFSICGCYLCRCPISAPPPVWKVANKMISDSVPRKARSASTKWSHESISGGVVVGGGGYKAHSSLILDFTCKAWFDSHLTGVGGSSIAFLFQCFRENHNILESHKNGMPIPLKMRWEYYKREDGNDARGSTTTRPVTRSKSRGISSLVSEPLMMSTKQEELMKKLEAFMIQQTQSNNDLKTSTNDLKAAMTALQTKQAIVEEGLGRGATFGANPNSKFSYLGGWAGRGRGLTQDGAGRGSSKVFDSWRTAESLPFKHNWDSLKLEGSNRRDHGASKD